MRASRFVILAFFSMLAAAVLGWRLLPAVPVLKSTALSRMPGWSGETAAAALPPFIAACAKAPWRRLPAGGGVLGITPGAWQAVCAAAGQARDAKTFFETRFHAVEWRQGWRPAGFFTGYFEPELAGSLTPADAYPVPLYRRPPELVNAELGRFRDDLAGQRIAGQVRDGTLLPFADRAQIDDGALAGRGLELVWLADPVEAFFLHIQGSGRVQLADGGVVRVGYDGQNGHAYSAIGRRLIEDGVLARDDLNLDSLAAWLRAHPEAGAALMRENRSYIFFRTLDGNGPIGSLGTVLTPQQSLAADPQFAPLGLPVWVDTQVREENGKRPYRRLLLAEDTGGAIKGAGRGDIFFGAGPDARRLAGHQKMPGRFILLVPRPPS